MPNGERNIAKRIGEKIFGKKEVTPSPEGKEEIEKRNEMIKGIAGIIEEEKSKTAEKYSEEKARERIDPTMLGVLEGRLKLIEKADKNFLRGKLNNKELIRLVGDNFQKKRMGLQWEVASRTRPDRLESEPDEEERNENEVKKLDEEVRKINAKERDWFKRMKREKVSKEEIAEVLGKKEGEKEKVEK